MGESVNPNNRSTEEVSQRCSFEEMQMVISSCRRRRRRHSLCSPSCTAEDKKYIEMLRNRTSSFRESSLNTDNYSPSLTYNKLLKDDGSEVFEKMKRRLSSC